MIMTMTHSRLHRLNDLNLKQLRALDRQRTVVLVPIGMVEEHGEHLPLGTDNFAVEALVVAAASWLLEHDKKLQLLMPSTVRDRSWDTRRSDLFRDGAVYGLAFIACCC
jgi:creatinine amidohydrolase/Fe(II)-dependent formamide hydrolase-like protein